MIAGVLLAAGASTRMGRDKALVKRAGESFLAHGVRHLWAACDEVVVVLGAHASTIRAAAEEEFERMVRAGRLHDDLQRAHDHGANGLEARFVVNKRWAAGMLGSARLGLAAALKRKPDAILLLPVDHPRVRPRTVVSLAVLVLAALSEVRGKDKRHALAYALVPRHRRRRGHPLALSPSLAQAIVRDGDAESLSDAVRRNARMIGFLDVPDAGVVHNVNGPGRARPRARSSRTRR